MPSQRRREVAKQARASPNFFVRNRDTAISHPERDKKSEKKLTAKRADKIGVTETPQTPAATRRLVKDCDEYLKSKGRNEKRNIAEAELGLSAKKSDKRGKYQKNEERRETQEEEEEVVAETELPETNNEEQPVRERSTRRRAREYNKKNFKENDKRS